MNKYVDMGRLTRDPEVRYSAGDNSIAVARYTLAINRRPDRNGNQKADFINCVAFGVAGEFAQKYFKKGMQVLISGRVQTGSYTNKDGYKIPTFEIVIEEQHFTERKGAQSSGDTGQGYQVDAGDGFMNIQDGIEDELPFN